MADTLLARLRKLDSCAVSDALDQHGLSGVVLGLAQLSGARRICGIASTVLLGPADGKPSVRHLCTAAVSQADAETIIVVAHGGRTDVAGWGGILTLAASERGVAGVVIDGACRDIDESRELNFPVYGRAAVPVTARGRIVEIDWNVPVQLGAVSVEPGDLVIADGSGVVFIPQNVAEKIITSAERIVAKENAMAVAVRSGRPVIEVMAGNYEMMLSEEVQ